jgi:POT family proton-dependent oligopeptide transporter
MRTPLNYTLTPYFFLNHSSLTFSKILCSIIFSAADSNLGATMSSRSHSQPKGLYMLFMTEMWERFSFYAMRALLVLYMTSLVERGGLGWTNAQALQLYSYYLGFAYVTPILGGYLADRFIGQRRSVILGGVLMALGHLLMAINHLSAFYSALFLISLGNGFFKPNVTSILGSLYQGNDPRRDAGYAIFYMGINVGGVLAGISSGYLQEHYGFDYGFAVAAIGMLVGLYVFYSAQKKYLGADLPISFESSSKDNQVLTFEEKQRIGVIAVLSVSLVFFIAAFEQAGGLLNLFASQWADRQIGSYTIPAAFFQSLNPAFVVMLSPLFSWAWTSLDKNNPFMSLKIALGLFLTACGFLLLWIVTPQEIMLTSGYCHSLWLVPFYGLVTAGEICILPVIWSAVSKLAPRHYLSSLMSVTLFAVGVGGWTAGRLASYVDDIGPSMIFVLIMSVCLLMSLLMILMTPKLKKWSHGVQ